MAQVGHLQEKDNAAVGRFATLQYQLNLRITAIDDPERPEGAPTHIVEGRIASGPVVTIGDAWMYETKRGRAVGAPMFSITLTDPMFGDTPLRLAAFPESAARPMQWRLELDRARRAQSDTDEAESHAA